MAVETARPATGNHTSWRPLPARCRVQAPSRHSRTEPAPRPEQGRPGRPGPADPARATWISSTTSRASAAWRARTSASPGASPQPAARVTPGLPGGVVEVEDAADGVGVVGAPGGGDAGLHCPFEHGPFGLAADGRGDDVDPGRQGPVGRPVDGLGPVAHGFGGLVPRRRRRGRRSGSVRRHRSPPAAGQPGGPRRRRPPGERWSPEVGLVELSPAALGGRGTASASEAEQPTDGSGQPEGDQGTPEGFHAWG